MSKFTTEYFIERANLKHNNKYDYSLVEYTGATTKVKIICPKHGEFEQLASSHLRGIGCVECGKEKTLSVIKRHTLDTFVFKAKEIHGNRYDYSNVIYKNCNVKISIICSKHGKFEQLASMHLAGQGCPKCVNKQVTTEEYIKKANKKHNNKYDYSKAYYTKSHDKIIIICSIHGEFNQTAYAHLNGAGCPYCNTSKGEMLIKEWLLNNDINFNQQQLLNGCKGKRKSLPFDFYLPEQNICIEFDGRQHYEVVKRSKDEQKNIDIFNKTKENDKIKDEYCLNNNIRLIRIPYWDLKNFETYLVGLLK